MTDAPAQDTLDQPTIEPLLILHPSAESKAADRALLQLVSALDRTRWTPIVAIPRRGPLIGALEALNAVVEVGRLGVVSPAMRPMEIARAILATPAAHFFVRRLVREHRPAVIHTHSGQVIGGAIAAALAAPQHTWHILGAPHAKGLSLGPRLAGRVITALSSGVIFGSVAARDAWSRLCPSTARTSQALRSAMDAASVAASPELRAQIRGNLHLDATTTLVMSVGPLTKNQGHHLLVEAAAQNRYSHPDTHYLIVGDAVAGDRTYGKALDRLIDGNGLTGIVRRIPYVGNERGLHAAADVICVPTLIPDPFHIAQLEAMAAGKPVIASATIGADEYVRTGDTGLLFEPGNSERLAFCLGALVGDGPKRERIGAAARHHHAQDFPIGRMKNELDRVWSRTAGRPFDLPAHRARIVHIAIDPMGSEAGFGSRAASVRSFVEQQVARGLQSELWLVGPSDAPSVDGVAHCRSFATDRPEAAQPRPALRRALDELDPAAIVHLHGATSGCIAALAQRLQAAQHPFVVTPHGELTPRADGTTAKMTGAIRSLLEGARLAHATGELEAAALHEFCPTTPVLTVPLGAILPAVPVVPERFDPAQRPLYTTWVPEGPTGNRVEAVVEGFARHVAAGQKGSLWLMGNRELDASLAARIQELGLGRRVTFQPAVDGTRRAALIAASDAHIVATSEGSTPADAMEAARLGRPLLVTLATELAQEVVGHGIGLVVDSADPAGVATAMARAAEATRGSQFEGLAERAAAFVAGFRSWDTLHFALQEHAYLLQQGPVGVVPAEGQSERLRESA